LAALVGNGLGQKTGVALSYRRRTCPNLAPYSRESVHPRSQRRVHGLKHIIQVMKATLACVIMVAAIFSVPVFATAFPIHIDVSLTKWKQLFPSHRPLDGQLPT
jgi:hypothetical protein